MLKPHNENKLDKLAEKDLTTNEAIVLKTTFEKIGSNIKWAIDKRISEYSNSLLFKYYSSFYYFLPKMALLEINDRNHNGYYIPPQESFFFEDKKTNKILTYTTRAETIIAPISKVDTIKNDTDSISISLTFKNSFEYDCLDIWLDPNLCNEQPFFAANLFNQILKSRDSSVKIELEDNIYTTEELEISPINLQLKPTENIILKLNLPCCLYGFNLKIKDLFKYKTSKLEKLVFYLKIKTKNFDLAKFPSPFKLNLIPVFNSFNDYSQAIFAAMNLSDSKLKHPSVEDAYAIDVISIYEGNDNCPFNGFFFEGKNQYYFNSKTQSLNYNVVLPQLDKTIEETGIYTYSNWTQATKISSLIEISSNSISSVSSKIRPLVMNDEIYNYKQDADNIFRVIDMLISGNIYTAATFVAVASLLKANENHILLFTELVQNLHLDTVTNELVLTTSNKFNTEHKAFLIFFTGIICDFINQNSFSFINNIIIE